jgi:ATP-dependent helicase YprA (DUF1998 family)
MSLAPLALPDPLDLEVRSLRAVLGSGLVHAGRLPGRAAVHRDPSRPLPGHLTERLGELGVEALWSHQAEAIDLLRDQRSVVIATGTASGKSPCSPPRHWPRTSSGPSATSAPRA